MPAAPALVTITSVCCCLSTTIQAEKTLAAPAAWVLTKVITLSNGVGPVNRSPLWKTGSEKNKDILFDLQQPTGFQTCAPWLCGSFCSEERQFMNGPHTKRCPQSLDTSHGFLSISCWQKLQEKITLGLPQSSGWLTGLGKDQAFIFPCYKGREGLDPPRRRSHLRQKGRAPWLLTLLALMQEAHQDNAGRFFSPAALVMCYGPAQLQSTKEKGTLQFARFYLTNVSLITLHLLFFFKYV